MLTLVISWLSSSATTRLSWENFALAEVSQLPRRWILRTFMIMTFHQTPPTGTIIFFTYSVKYHNIYKMHRHNMLYWHPCSPQDGLQQLWCFSDFYLSPSSGKKCVCPVLWWANSCKTNDISINLGFTIYSAILHLSNIILAISILASSLWAY